jgi:glycine oxidase
VPFTAADPIVRAVERCDAVIVGGGVIGLACARRAQERGLDVRVLERDVPGSGATGVAAGILAPDPDTPGFSALARQSAELWPVFAEELGDVGYTRCGSLVLSFDDARPLGQWLDGETVRALEPGLSKECTGAIHVPDDAQVDPRRVVAALEAVLGEAIRPHADVVELHADVVTLADGTHISAERVVLAAGAWSARRLARRLPVRPVKGQTVRLRGPAPATRIVRSEQVYVVPRATGETVVGATIEEAGFDTAVTEHATTLLLREAVRAVPAVAELELVESAASLRPGTPDDCPLIGEWEGLLVAGGHYRNGILLAPVTADVIAALLVGEPPPVDIEPFDPARFYNLDA